MDQVLAAFVGGSVLATLVGFVGDWLRDKRAEGREGRARAAQRELERNAFQRQTLLELQETLLELAAGYGAAFQHLLGASVGQPDFALTALPPELNEPLRALRDRVSLLCGRVLDEQGARPGR